MFLPFLKTKGMRRRNRTRCTVVAPHPYLDRGTPILACRPRCAASDSINGKKKLQTRVKGGDRRSSPRDSASAVGAYCPVDAIGTSRVLRLESSFETTFPLTRFHGSVAAAHSGKATINAVVWVVGVSAALLDIADAKCGRVLFPPCGPTRDGIIRASWKRNATTVMPDHISHRNVCQSPPCQYS